jgi:hypothetical protein
LIFQFGEGVAAAAATVNSPFGAMLCSPAGRGSKKCRDEMLSVLANVASRHSKPTIVNAIEIIETNLSLEPRVLYGSRRINY